VTWVKRFHLLFAGLCYQVLDW